MFQKAVSEPAKGRLSIFLYKAHVYQYYIKQFFQSAVSRVATELQSEFQIQLLIVAITLKCYSLKINSL